MLLAPADAALRVDLGIVLFRAHCEREALVNFRRACELEPDFAPAWYNLAQAQQLQGHIAESVAALKHVLEIDPSHVKAQASMIRALTGAGRIDDAIRELREILQRDPDRADAWFALADLKTVRLTARDLRCVSSCLARPNLDPLDRIRLEFVQARAFEDLGEYARAWRALVRANAEQRQRVEWNAATEHARVGQIINEFSRPVARSSNTDMGREVIFIASLPRSGSTLVEQILASHPDVRGAGEIPDLQRVVRDEAKRYESAYPTWVTAATPRDWERLGNDYLSRTAAQRGAAERIVDKNLLNWLTVGAALSMLPAARVIVVRRDPVETCLSCFRQWFDQAGPFTYDIRELSTVCSDFVRLTGFWIDKYPKRVLDLKYEGLIASPEPTIRRLLEFCNLSFSSDCLRFYETPRAVMSIPSAAQVRQPLHGGTTRAALYGRHLDGLRAALLEAGLSNMQT